MSTGVLSCFLPYNQLFNLSVIYAPLHFGAALPPQLREITAPFGVRSRLLFHKLEILPLKGCH